MTSSKLISRMIHQIIWWRSTYYTV